MLRGGTGLTGLQTGWETTKTSDYYWYIELQCIFFTLVL